MRTVTLLSAIIISNGLLAIAESNGYSPEFDDQTLTTVAIILIVSILMDIIDFIKN